MAKYVGVCLARQGTVRYTTGDILEPVRKELSGLSETIPMPCEKYIDEKYSFVEVFIPQAGNTWVGFSCEEFDRYFLVVNGWLPE